MTFDKDIVASYIYALKMYNEEFEHDTENPVLALVISAIKKQIPTLPEIRGDYVGRCPNCNYTNGRSDNVCPKCGQLLTTWY